MLSYDTSTGVQTVNTNLTGGAVSNGMTYYIGDVPPNTYWWYWPNYYPTYLPPTVYVTGPERHAHEYEQVRSSEGGYEARLFCRTCGETKRIGRSKP